MAAPVEIGSSEDGFSIWEGPLNKKPLSEPIVLPPKKLEDVLENHTFTDYGRLSTYKKAHQEGLDSFAFEGAQLVRKIKIDNMHITPKLQADLLVCYIMEKASQNGLNAVEYITSVYSVETTTWQLAQAGYTKGSERLEAWDKLMKADRKQMEKESINRRIRRIPIDTSASSLPGSLIHPLSTPHSPMP